MFVEEEVHARESKYDILVGIFACHCKTKEMINALLS